MNRVAELNLTKPDLLKQLCYMDGRWTTAASGATLEVENPATGAVVAHVPSLSAAETLAAIEAAAKAQAGWRRATANERCAKVRRWFELMLEHSEDLARIVTLEHGKSLKESRAEVAYAAAFLQWFAEEGKRTYGEVVPSPSPDRRIVTIRQPVGVCAAITPWNFPLAMITRKAGPALAAGCAMILKPAEQTPLSALALAALAHEAGFPAGVFNVVTGVPAEIGGMLTSSPIVRKLSFTGSTEVGALLMAQCAPTMKRISFELGGNAPLIVLADADLDAAVEGALVAKFRNGGQSCVGANRLYIEDSIYASFAERFAARVAALRVGDGFSEGTDVGPLIDADAVAKVSAHVADAVGRGARVLTGGKLSAAGPRFWEPTVLADVPADSLLTREETFGPVAPLIRVSGATEALRLANDTPFGLAAYAFTRDHARVWKLCEELEVGMVGINTGLISTEVAPFGGVKLSGLGREGARQGIEEYLEVKYLCLAGM